MLGLALRGFLVQQNASPGLVRMYIQLGEDELEIRWNIE